MGHLHMSKVSTYILIYPWCLFCGITCERIPGSSSLPPAPYFSLSSSGDEASWTVLASNLVHRTWVLISMETGSLTWTTSFLRVVVGRNWVLMSRGGGGDSFDGFRHAPKIQDGESYSRVAWTVSGSSSTSLAHPSSSLTLNIVVDSPSLFQFSFYTSSFTCFGYILLPDCIYVWPL